MSWQDFPMITCPHCGKEFQVDDYYNFSTGDSFDCGKCEKEIFIWATDTTLSGDIQAKPERRNIDDRKSEKSNRN